MSFAVGQKVVCIHEYTTLRRKQICPNKGEVYTVREVHPPSITGNSKYGILLEEIVNQPRKYYPKSFGETGFYVHRFRPLIECKTDISIFTAMLQDTKIKEPA